MLIVYQEIYPCRLALSQQKILPAFETISVGEVSIANVA